MKFFKKSLVVVGVLLVCFGVLIVFDNVSQYASYDDEVAADSVAAPVVVKEPTWLFGMAVDSLHINNAEVKRNQRFTDLLDGYFVDGRAKRLLATLPRDVFDFRKVATSKKIHDHSRERFAQKSAGTGI